MMSPYGKGWDAFSAPRSPSLADSCSSRHAMCASPRKGGVADSARDMMSPTKTTSASSSSACSKVASPSAQRFYVAPCSADGYMPSFGEDGDTSIMDEGTEAMGPCAACADWEDRVATLTTAWKNDLTEKAWLKHQLIIANEKIQAQCLALQDLNQQLAELRSAVDQQEDDIREQVSTQVAAAMLRVRVAEAGELEAVSKVQKLQQRVADLLTELGKAKRQAQTAADEKALLRHELSKARATALRMTSDAATLRTPISGASEWGQNHSTTFYNQAFSPRASVQDLTELTDDHSDLAPTRSLQHPLPSWQRGAQPAGAHHLQGLSDTDTHLASHTSWPGVGDRREAEDGSAQTHSGQPQVWPQPSRARSAYRPLTELRSAESELEDDWGPFDMEVPGSGLASQPASTAAMRNSDCQVIHSTLTEPSSGLSSGYSPHQGDLMHGQGKHGEVSSSHRLDTAPEQDTESEAPTLASGTATPLSSAHESSGASMASSRVRWRSVEPAPAAQITAGASVQGTNTPSKVLRVSTGKRPSGAAGDPRSGGTTRPGARLQDRGWWGRVMNSCARI